MARPGPFAGRAGLIFACLVLSSGYGFPARAEANGLRIATFGTSLTANGGWQAPLAEALETCIHRPVDVGNRGKAGAASNWGVEEAAEVAADRPDIVFLEFAANDSALNRRIGVSESTANMRRIIRTLRERKPDVVIYVTTMNPFSGLRSWIRPWRDRYEDAHRDLAAEMNAGYLDHRPAWATREPDEIYLAIADGVHPTPGIAAAIIVPNIVERLTSDGAISCAAGPDRSGRVD